MKAGKRVIKWMAGLLLLAALVALAAFLTRPPQLLERASRVAIAGDWDFIHHPYYWLSNEQVLFCTYSDKVFLRNVNTNTIQPLARLTSMANDLNARFELSPDRKWILRADDYTEQVIVSTLDGVHHVRWPRPRDRVGLFG